MNITIQTLMENLIHLDGKVTVKHYDGEELTTLSRGGEYDIPQEVREREIKYFYALGDELVIEVE